MRRKEADQAAREEEFATKARRIGIRPRPPPPGVSAAFLDEVEDIWDNPDAPQIVSPPALRPDSLNIHLDLFFERLSTTSSVRQRELERQLRRTREDIDVLNGILAEQQGAFNTIVESTYYADEAQARALPAVVGRAARRTAIDTQEAEMNITAGFRTELNRIARRIVVTLSFVKRSTLGKQVATSVEKSRST